MPEHETWGSLVDDVAARRPDTFPVFATHHLPAGIAHPERWLRARRLERRVMTLARGLHIARPLGTDESWRPPVVETAYRVASIPDGLLGAYVSGLTAAAVHGAVPMGHGAVHMTVPRQRRALWLPAIGTTIAFHQRAERVLGSPLWEFGAGEPDHDGPDILTLSGELGAYRVSSPIQTALDLLHSPLRAGDPEGARAAASRLLRATPRREVARVARRQRRHSAAERASMRRLGLTVRDPDLRA